MKMKTLLVMAGVLPIIQTANADIQVSKDQLSLKGLVETTLHGEGQIQETETYAGAWLDLDRTMLAELDVHEDDANSDTVYLYGRADALLNGANAELELFTIAEADFSGLREAPDNRLWDSTTPLITEAKARFRWEFCSTEKVNLTASYANKGTNGYVSFKLVNETLNSTLVDFATNGFSFGDTIAEVTLIAGHTYSMKGATYELNNQDDDEASLQIAFDGDVSFSSVGSLSCRGGRAQ